MIPLPTQLSGGLFLSLNNNALLADEPRVGKTGTAIIATDYNFENTVLVITTKSGRAVWHRDISTWSVFPHRVRILTKPPAAEDVLDGWTIVSWDAIADPAMRAALMRRKFKRVILDEAHRAKDFDNKRTRAAYGDLIDDGLALANNGVISGAGGVWPLTGTPIPHSPKDLYPMLRALAPERLRENVERGWPDVTTRDAFTKRYCVMRPKKISRFRSIQVVVGGRNQGELHERMAGFMLLRTQADVGIRPPVYELMPLAVTDAMRRQADGDLKRASVLAAVDAGKTRELEMHLGTLRRHTGHIKVDPVIEAVTDEFEDGLDKIVLAYWHKDVGDALADGLAKFGLLRLDGSTSAAARAAVEQQFRDDKTKRVFLAQIEAAGEAIDLSAAAMLWFVETVFSPRGMKQMSLRITNHTQTRQAIVRVCVIEGSIDEALQASLLRLWTTIREVLSNDSSN